MHRFFRSFRRNLIVPITLAWACAAIIPAALAQSAPQLDKHARKIEKRLTRYRPGTYLDFEFRDSSESYGSLGQLAQTSFQFTDSDSNLTQTHPYGDVKNVRRAKEYIGAGSEGGHHLRLLVPILVGAAAAGGVAAFEAFR